MSVLPIHLKKSQYQSILLLGLLAFFIAHFTLLNPSSLEEDFSEVRAINPQELMSFFQNETSTLAKNVPTGVAPAYAIRDLEYFATDDQKKHWKMLARKSFMYQEEQMVHARDAVFIWAEGQITAKEAVSFQQKNEVELYGDVVATLKNGLVINTEYVKIITSPRTQIIIPMTEPVSGHQQVSSGSRFRFKGKGLFYESISEDQEVLRLLSHVDTEIETQEKTRVLSDSAVYHKLEETLEFEMMDSQPLDKQFVLTHQKALDLKSRILIADLPEQKIQLLTAKGDVSFQDFTNPEHPVSGTSGKAIYKEETNLLFLMDFPQVYQDKDTMTGDTIIYDRTKDTIEVDQSNAFNKR